MSSFKDFLKIKFESLAARDRIMIIMNALKSASSVLEGTGKTSKELTDYSDDLIEHYFILEGIKKVSYQGFPVKEETKKINQELVEADAERKKSNSPF